MKGDWAGSGGLWILYDGDGREWAWWFIRLSWCIILLAPFAWVPWPADGLRIFRWMTNAWGIGLGILGMLVVWRLVRMASDAFIKAVQTHGWRRTKSSGEYWYVAAFFVPFIFFFQIMGTFFRWRSWGYFLAFQICLLLAFMLLLELFVGLRRVSEAKEAAEEAAQRSRLEPHFLFNVLNDIQAQIPKDLTAATLAMARMGELMRSLLALAGKPMIALGEELAFVESYLGFQRLRLGSRLKVEVQVPEEAEALLVPTLSVHTLVENAIKHGISRRPNGGALNIRVQVEPRYEAFTTALDLNIRVENEVDPNVALDQTGGTGTGLATLRGRLQDPSDLHLERHGDWFCATVKWRQA